jgi:nucleoside-diphosphate kinase
MIEQTLVLIKPDGVQMRLIGKILSRFEDTGLKISAMKMVWPDEDKARNHYPMDEEWAKNMFKKTKDAAEKNNEPLKYDNYEEMGKFVNDALVEFIQESPVIAFVLEGPSAIELVRKLIGHTEPKQAAPGTIRGDFASIETYVLANFKDRPLRNLIHASDSVENAKKEIALWFDKEEVHDYKRPGDNHAFD